MGSKTRDCARKSNMRLNKSVRNIINRKFNTSNQSINWFIYHTLYLTIETYLFSLFLPKIYFFIHIVFHHSLIYLSISIGLSIYQSFFRPFFRLKWNYVKYKKPDKAMLQFIRVSGFGYVRIQKPYYKMRKKCNDFIFSKFLNKQKVSSRLYYYINGMNFVLNAGKRFSFQRYF